jgi:WD40 repeat protein
LYSSCFLCENSNIYIVFGKQNIVYDENERPIKVFNLSGKLIKDMNESGEGTNYIDNYYDEKSSKHFIISKYKMNDDDYIKSFDFKENKLFHKYRENNNNYDDNSDFENSDYTDDIIINDKGKIVELFDFSYDNYIRIWNFHSGELLTKININIYSDIYSFFLWNKKYLIMGCNDCSIEILDIEKETIIRELAGHLDVVKTIRKLIHPKYGECLLTQGKKEENIKLWITINLNIK